MTDHPWRLVGLAFVAGASLGRRRDPAAIVNNVLALIGELLTVVTAERARSWRARSWIDQSELAGRA